MALSTGVQIARYYDFFRDKEIVFTKANLQSLRIDPKQIYLKYQGDQWPCLINSSSLQMAKIIIGTGTGVYTELAKKKDLSVSLRFCFLDQNNSPIQFFVNCVVDKIDLYQNTDKLALVTLNFTQKPPDDLIMRMGEFIEASENFKNRKEDRILINKESLRKLSMEKEETVIYIDNVPRRCILKNISFSGANVMLVGIPKFLIGKPISLQIEFIDMTRPLLINGVIPHAVFLEGRKDISSVNVAFSQETIPMEYKFHINNFITSYQKNMLNSNNVNGVNIVNPDPEPVASPVGAPVIGGQQQVQQNNQQPVNTTQNSAAQSVQNI